MVFRRRSVLFENLPVSAYSPEPDCTLCSVCKPTVALLVAAKHQQKVPTCRISMLHFWLLYLPEQRGANYSTRLTLLYNFHFLGSQIMLHYTIYYCTTMILTFDWGALPILRRCGRWPMKMEDLTGFRNDGSKKLTCKQSETERWYAYSRTRVTPKLSRNMSTFSVKLGTLVGNILRNILAEIRPSDSKLETIWTDIWQFNMQFVGLRRRQAQKDERWTCHMSWCAYKYSIPSPRGHCFVLFDHTI